MQVTLVPQFSSDTKEVTFTSSFKHNGASHSANGKHPEIDVIDKLDRVSGKSHMWGFMNHAGKVEVNGHTYTYEQVKFRPRVHGEGIDLTDRAGNTFNIFNALCEKEGCTLDDLKFVDWKGTYDWLKATGGTMSSTNKIDSTPVPEPDEPAEDESIGGPVDIFGKDSDSDSD